MKKIILLTILFGTIFLTACSQKTNSTKNINLDKFANCIKNTGITIYIQDNCGHCINQEKLFGNSFNKLNIVNCTKELNKCSIIGGGTPTRILPDNTQLEGIQSLKKLSEVSNCPLYE